MCVCMCVVGVCLCPPIATHNIDSQRTLVLLPHSHSHFDGGWDCAESPLSSPLENIFGFENTKKVRSPFFFLFAKRVLLRSFSLFSTALHSTLTPPLPRFLLFGLFFFFSFIIHHLHNPSLLWPFPPSYFLLSNLFRTKKYFITNKNLCFFLVYLTHTQKSKTNLSLKQQPN